MDTVVVCAYVCIYMHTLVDRARDGQKVIQRRSADGRAKGSIHPSYFIPADTIRGVCIRGGYQITRVVCIHRISILRAHWSTKQE